MFYFFEPSHMALGAGKRRREPSLDDVFYLCKGKTHPADFLINSFSARQTKHIRIIMPAGGMRGLNTPNLYCAHPLNFVGGNARAVACSAYGNAKGFLIVCNCACGRNYKIRIII